VLLLDREYATRWSGAPRPSEGGPSAHWRGRSLLGVKAGLARCQSRRAASLAESELGSPSRTTTMERATAARYTPRHAPQRTPARRDRSSHCSRINPPQGNTSKQSPPLAGDLIAQPIVRGPDHLLLDRRRVNAAATRRAGSGASRLRVYT